MPETDPLLPRSPTTDGIIAVRYFLAYLGVLFSLPFAASQIAVYDVLFDSACRYYSIPKEQCLVAPESTQFVANLLANVSILNAVVATIVLVATTIWSDRNGGRKQGLVWFMAFSAAGVMAFPLVAYKFSPGTSLWRMLFPYLLLALSGTPTLLLNLSMLYITDLVAEPATRTKCLSLLVGFAMLVQSVAPGLGGAVLQTGVSLFAYMLVCGIWMAVGTVIFALVLKPSDHADADSNSEAVVSDGLLQTLGIYDFFEVMRSPNAVIVALNFLLSNELGTGILDLIMVYGKRQFAWNGVKVGQTTFMLFGVRTIWALVGFPLIYSKLTERWGTNSKTVDRADRAHMVACNVLTVVAYCTMALANTSAKYTTGIFILANDGIMGTVWINSLIKHVPPSRKGAFMGALSLINKPAGAILPAILMKTLQYTTDTTPQAVLWVVAGIATALTFSLAWIKTASADPIIS